MKTVFVLCMVDSIHSARWLQLFIHRQDLHLVVFPSGPHRRVHDDILTLSYDYPHRFTVAATSNYFGVFTYLLEQIPALRQRSRLLRRAVQKYQPEFIHALEMQHSGYLLLRSGIATDGAEIFVTNWGSDLFWFQNKSRHKKKLIKLLEVSDTYLAECDRDVRIAKQLGFSGRVADVLPNSGFFTLGREPVFEVKEKLLLVKGYSNWHGLGIRAMLGVLKARRHLSDWRVVFYSSSTVVRLLAAMFRVMFSINLRAFPKHHFQHSEMLAVFAQARIHLGVSRSDAISTAVLESMYAGCLPIQSSTSCAGEWFTDGKGGVLLQDHSLKTIENAIIRAIGITETTSYQTENYEAVASRASAKLAQTRADSLYK